MPKKSSSKGNSGSGATSPVKDVSQALGSMLYHNGHYAQARSVLEAIIHNKPKQFHSRLLLIQTLQMLGKLTAARKECEALLEQRPEHPGVIAELALILAQQGEKAGALNLIVDTINKKATDINAFMQFTKQ